MKIAVIGAGSWGTALACLLARKGFDVKLWARSEHAVNAMKNDRENRRYLPGVKFSKTLQSTYDPKEAVEDAQAIVFAIPSRGVREGVQQFSPYMNSGQIVVNVSKGLEAGSLLRLSEVFSQCLPDYRICTLSGPSHAEEVGKGIPTACVVSSSNMDAAHMIQSIFMDDSFRVYTNADLIGVELGGALKNVIALAAGISDGLGFGDNSKAALMTRGSVEVARLGVAMGAKSKTFSGLSGIGDLIVTCTSMHSRNRRAGILLGQGKSLDETLQEVQMVVEGVNTAQAAYELSLKYGVNMPITEEIYEVVFKGKSARQAVYDLMSRDKTSEHEDL